MIKKDFANIIHSYIEDGLIEDALNFLAHEINEIAQYLHIDVVMLKSQYNTAKNDYIVKGILERGEFDRLIARINYAILDLVKQIENKSEKINAKRNGRLLYKIASKMPVNLECKCIVRIAFNDEILLRDATIDNETNIQSIQIAEIMSVELIDTNEIGVFKIRTYTDDEQFIVSNEYTQWIFLVKPQKEGIHSLTLKIAVVELINGKERKRNIIVEKEVFIISGIEVSEEIGFEESNLTFLFPIFQSIGKIESKNKSASIKEKLKLTKKTILSLVAFVAPSGVSCWATVESLHMLLPLWSVILLWAVTVIFFVIASIGTKLIVDSFNQNAFIKNRGWRLIGGIILLLAFWGCFILPTNTHTFFYRATIKDVLIRDLTETKGKLQELGNVNQVAIIISQEKTDFRVNIDAIFSKFAAEINNPGSPGWKNETEAIIIELEGELGKIQRLKLECQSFQCRQELIMAMREQIYTLLDSKLKNTYDSPLENINKGLDKSEINNLIAKIEAIQARIDKNLASNDEPTDTTTTTLSQAYKIIEKHSNVLIFAFEKQYPEQMKNTIEEKNVYAGVSKTERMRSVIYTWKDFFAGKYGNRVFAFWITIAALVGIAGFIFFDIAFAKKNIKI